MIRQRFVVGDRVQMSDDALENYGEKYRDKDFVVESVSKRYMPAKDFFAKGKPTGYHPGFDESSGSALYDLEGFNSSLYDWELSPTHGRRSGRNRASTRSTTGLRHEILTAMARALFVNTWATYEEERGRSFSGQQLMDVAPATPSPARTAAKVLAKMVERENGKSLVDLYDQAVAVGGKADPDAFGHYLAMQALGHGVSWFDRNPEFPLVVPYFEFAKTSARHYYFPRS